jgi:hypothetical protein
MPLSNLAQEVLELHAGRPRDLFYGVDALGSMYHDSDIKRLDEVYRQLAEMGLIEQSNVVVSFFGEPKNLYRITSAGQTLAARESVA